MSTTKRRQRRAHAGGGTGTPSPAGTAQPATPKVPHYRWKQFPVYFAFWLGALIFLELGIIAGASGDTTFTTVISAVVALFLGFGVARLVVTWMMARSWVKPRPRRR